MSKSDTNNPFAITANEIRGRNIENLVRLITLGMTWALILPVLVILGFLLIKAWPALSIEFILDNPEKN